MLRTIKNAWIRALVAFDVRDPLKRTDEPYDFPEDCNELQPEASDGPGPSAENPTRELAKTGLREP